MKTLSFISVAALFLLLFTYTQAQNPTESIKAALKTGNTDALAQFFAPSIDLILPDKEDRYTRQAATEEVRRFFTQNRPTGFTQKHETTAPNGAKCIIGNLQTSGGSYRTGVLIKNGKIEDLTLEK